MERVIQVRNLPDALHRALRARAAMALSGYLLAELRQIAERPALADFRERLHKRRPPSVALDSGALLRAQPAARSSCSAVAGWLLQTPAGQLIEQRIDAQNGTLKARHHRRAVSCSPSCACPAPLCSFRYISTKSR